MELLESALEDIPDSKLPSYLYKVHRQLRSTHDSTVVKKLLSLPSEEESAPDAPGSTFIQTLLSSRFLFSTNSEVAHLVGCILCDVIRLGSPSSERETRKQSSQISLPFPTSKCTEVLRCIAQPLKEAARLTDLPNQAGLIVERASSCRVMAFLLPYCDPGEVECLVSPFFGLLEAPLLVPSSSPVSTLSASLSENLSQILLDIIHASSNSITAAQLSLLLTAVVRASPALRSGNGVLSSTLFTSFERRRNGSDKNYDTATFSAMTAGRVLSECLEVVQDALNGMVMKHLTNVLTVKAGTDSYDLTSFIPSAVEEKDHLSSEYSPISREDRLTAADSDEAATTAGGVKNSTSRRQHFYQISKHLEYFVAMIELNVNFVQILLPNLQAFLNHDDGDFRRLLLRSLGMGYASHPLAIPTYRSFFENFLEHVDDVKMQIRVEMIQFVGLIVEKARREWLGHSPWGRVRLISPMMSHHSPVATKKEEFEEWDLWEVLMSVVVQRLLDPIFSVRLQAVSTLSVCVKKSPELLRLGKIDLEHTLGLRMADKNPKVRDATLDHLCKLYRALPEAFSWVPSILFTTVPMDDDVKVVEIVLEMLMLPSSDGKGATEEGALDPQQVAGSNSSMRVEMPLFRFEDTRNPSTISNENGTTHPCSGVDIHDDLLLPSPTVQHSIYSRYLERWCRLCDNISPSMFRELVGIAKKKSLLRSAVTKLFDLREVAQQSSRSGMDAEADESTVSNRSSVVESKQRTVHNVHRLLTFLQTATGAKKNEWNALFRCRDKKVVQAILRFCQHSNEEWEAERLELLLTIKGRVDIDTYAFVKDRLVKMLSFPFQLQHLSGLLECLRMASTGQKRIATSTGVLSLFIRADDAGKHLTIPCTVLIRVLQIFLFASPSYYRRCCSTIADVAFQLVLDSAICEGKASSYFSSFSDILTFVESLLHCLKELPVALRYLTTGERVASFTLCKVLMDSQKSLLLDTLKALCTGSSPLLTYSEEQLSQHLLKKEDVKVLSSIFKNAALCLLSLVNVATPSAGDERPMGMVGEDKTAEMAATAMEKEAIAQLAQDVLRSLQHSAFLSGSSGKVSVTKTKEIEGTSTTALLAWLQTLRVWRSKSSVVPSKSPTSHTTLSPSLSPDTGTWTLSLPPTLQKSVGDVLLKVCHLYSTPVLEKQQRKKPGERAERVRHPLLHCADVLVDCAAKALSAVTLSSPSSERVDQVRQALDILLEAFRILRSVEGEEIGGSTIHDALHEQTGSSPIVARLAILQQLAKLVRLPSSDMVKEIGVAVVLSLEENLSIRRVLQEKFAKHILHSTCDMRYVTFLLLLAIPVANKSEYHELRVVVQKVGAHLRKKQLGSDSGASVSLASPAAMSCYLEYTIPFIVLFLSRHPHYEMQRDKLHFIGFQRVWHLIFEELLSHGIQCISFVKELLFRIKQAKDALQPDGIRTKVLSDLGSSVLEQLLSQYKIGTDALKRYPGKLLLPNFFISPSSRDPAFSSLSVAQTSYLDSSLHVPIHVPFRLPIPGVSPSPTVDAPGEARISPASSKEATFPLPTGVTAPASSTPPSKRGREEPFEDAPKEVPQAIDGRDARYFGESQLPRSLEKMHERMLDEVLYLLRQRTAGLTKSDIALIRWNEIKKDVAQICSEKQYVTTVIDGEQKINPDGHFPNSSASLLENLLDFSKNKLKELYAQAKD